MVSVVPAERRPREPRSRPHLVRVPLLVGQELADAEIGGDRFPVHNLLRRIRIFGDEGRRLTYDRADLALQISHARFHRVAADDLDDAVVRKRDLFLRDAVRRDLLGNQIALGDLHFLLLRVAVDLDDLHAVEQR